MTLATTTPEQDRVIRTAKAKLNKLGGAVANAAAPLFDVIRNLDEQLESSMRRAASLNDELDARIDNP